MQKEKSNANHINWDRLLPALQRQLDEKGKSEFHKTAHDFTPIAPERLQALHTKIFQNLYQEITKTISNIRRPSVSQAKQIILNLEVVPFRLTTRSNPVEDLGRPWRHDGGPVTFKLKIPHDNLEIYSPKGEFLSSYPVQSTGEVKIDDLAAGVYLLYLEGRKITGME